MECLDIKELQKQIAEQPLAKAGYETGGTAAGSPLRVDLLQSFVAMRSGMAHAKIFAFTSARRKEGVTHVVRLLGSQLAAYTGEDVLLVSVHALRRLRLYDLERIELLRGVERRVAEHMWLENVSRAGTPGVWIVHDAHVHGAEAAIDESIWKLLRQRFGFVLLDCRSLESSAAVLPVAEKVDGTVLVVSSGVSSKREIQNASRILNMGKAPMVGCILNRRTYPVPNLLYRFLQR